MTQIQNAKIESTCLGTDDGRITFWLLLTFGSGGGQGFGGCSLRDVKVMSLINLLQTIGVSNWEQLKGQYVRVDRTDSRLTKIGHIIEDKWFDLAKDLT
jgi:hypothetical protein